MPSPKKPRKPKKAATSSKSGEQMMDALMKLAARKRPTGSIKRPSKLPPAVKAILDNPEADSAELSQEDKQELVIRMAEKIVKNDDNKLYHHYVNHFSYWLPGATEGDLCDAQSDISEWVDEGYLDNLHRHLAIHPFFYCDYPSVLTENTFLYMVHLPVVGNDRLFGCKQILETLIERCDSLKDLDEGPADVRAEAIAHGIATLFDCCDNRLLPHLEQAWVALPKLVRLHLSQIQRTKPGELEAKFWLNRAVEALPASPEFRLAVEHLQLMNDESCREHAFYLGHLTRQVFNFGLEKGNEEVRKSTKVDFVDFLNAHGEQMAQIRSFSPNQPYITRWLDAWGCSEKE